MSDTSNLEQPLPSTLVDPQPTLEGIKSLFSSWEYEYSLQVTFVEGVLRNVLGKILTVADAVIADGRQNKAAKDMLRSAMTEGMSTIRRAAMPSGMGECGYKLTPNF